MIVFVQSTREIQVRVGAVREYASADNDSVELRMADGTTHEVNREKWERALRDANRTFIAAAPDTYALRPLLDETGELCVVREAVVAWHLNQDGFALPVTCSGTCRINEHFPAIHHPNGTVDDSSTFYECLDDWAQETRNDLLKAWATSQDALIN